MNIVDEFKLYVSAYFGVETMDEYPLKVYVLSDIEKEIRDHVSKYDISLDFDQVVNEIMAKDLLEKLNDAIFVLRQMNYKMDFILMINHKIKELKSKNR